MNSNKTNKHRNEADEFADLDQELRLLLNDYTVEYPSEEAIARTIDTLRPYVGQPAAKRLNLFPLTLRQLHIRLLFWIMNAIFFGSGLLAWGVWDGDPYMILLFISPIPFLLGLLEIFRGRDEGLLELEMSCKFSAQQLMLMKLVVIGVYNMLLCFILIAIFSLFGEPLLLSKLVMYWATPLTVTASIGFALANRMRSAMFAPISLVLWLFAAAAFINVLDFERQSNMMSVIICGVLSVLAIGLLIVQVNRLRRDQFDEVIY